MSAWIARFGAALSFLTIFPLPVSDSRVFARSAMCFPFVGLLIGMGLWGVHALLEPFCGAWAIALVLLVVGVLLTRALHLDGLADAVDGLWSHQNRERMLEIMRDSRIGTMGAVALILNMLARFQLLAHMPHGRMGIALLVSCALSRMAMALAMMAFPYARTQGLATVFTEGLKKTDIFFVLLGGALIAVGCLGVRGIFYWSAAVLACMAIMVFCKKKLGGYTGDILGAVNEMVEIACLALIVGAP